MEPIILKSKNIWVVSLGEFTDYRCSLCNSSQMREVEYNLITSVDEDMRKLYKTAICGYRCENETCYHIYSTDKQHNVKNFKLVKPPELRVSSTNLEQSEYSSDLENFIIYITPVTWIILFVGTGFISIFFWYLTYFGFPIVIAYFLSDLKLNQVSRKNTMMRTIPLLLIASGIIGLIDQSGFISGVIIGLLVMMYYIPLSYLFIRKNPYYPYFDEFWTASIK